MSTKQTHTVETQNRAIVLQSLYAQIGKSAMRVGEVEKFVNKWGKNHMTRYQVDRILHEMARERLISVDEITYRGKKVSGYSICTTGAMALVSLIPFLPKQIREAMGPVLSKVTAALCEYIEQYKDQGVTHG